MKTIEELWKKLEKVELVQIHPVEAEVLYRHCFEFKKPFIVEVGSAHGASSIILAEAAQELEGTLYCIDNFPENYDGAAPGKFGDYARKQFLKNMKQYLGKRFIYLDTNSSVAKHEMVISLPGIQVLFIDGDHSYEGVKTDCENLFPLLAPGGYVGFHDHNNVAFSGVKKAAEEFCNGWKLTDSVWDLAIYQKPWEN